MLSVKNARIGPSEAPTARLTTMAPTRRRSTWRGASRNPTSALNTYSEGSVTQSVSRNRRGSLSVEARSCFHAPGRPSKRAYQPMKNP